MELMLASHDHCSGRVNLNEVSMSGEEEQVTFSLGSIQKVCTAEGKLLLGNETLEIFAIVDGVDSDIDHIVHLSYQLLQRNVSLNSCSYLDAEVYPCHELVLHLSELLVTSRQSFVGQSCKKSKLVLIIDSPNPVC